MITANPKPATHSPAMAVQYELLRAAMLGAALPPNSRSGLIVLLHRGMWAWARMTVVDPARQRPIPAATVRPSNLHELCDERRAVVHLLATMATTIIDRRPA